MSEEHELPSDSDDDDDDEDYVPEGAEEPVSEAESEGDEESAPEDENNENKQLSKKGSKKRRSNGKISNSKRKKSEEKNSKNDSTEDNETKKLTEEEEKKKADSLWADFMKDTGAPLKAKVSNPKPKETAPIIRPRVEEKVKITKIFEFAGEEVKVEKEVPADSAEARLILSTSEKSCSNSSSAQCDEKNSLIRGGKRGGGGGGGGLGGISSVLNQIGKKAKISTLEKSKLDWDNFKREEKLDEEITTHNKGKSGFLERQDFLQRTDVRQFEIEKNLRTTTRRSNR